MTHDAADARLGVEARHKAAHALVKRAQRDAMSLAAVIDEALDSVSGRCLNDEADRVAVLQAIVNAISESADAHFIREVLGDVPADRNARLHSHGALSSHLATAAWRLAGGV
jgi:hypothetical protein